MAICNISDISTKSSLSKKNILYRKIHTSDKYMLPDVNLNDEEQLLAYLWEYHCKPCI